MFIQLTTPRIVLDLTRHPEYIYLHTLLMPDVSEGEVLFTGPVDPEHGQRGTKTLEPREILPLAGGLSVRTFILPFWELFQGGPKTAVHDGAIVRAADLKITRYCTAGFQVVVKSAFRASPREYLEHTLAFHMAFPATGGGILRLANADVDLANPSFNPWAVNPSPPSEAATAELREAYARTHMLTGRSDIDSRRQARIVAAEACMRAEARAATPTLPDVPSKALPPKIDRCPTCDSPDPKRHPAMQHEGEVQVCRDPWHGGELS